MKYLMLVMIFTPLFITGMFAQNSGITIGDSNETIDGTIRYNNATGFEGLHLGNWVPFNGTNTAAGPWTLSGTNVHYTGGNVGIGTNSPATRLHILGSENNGTTGAVMITSGLQNMLIDGNEIDTNEPLGLYLNNNNSNNVILATGGGNVGIGTTTPAWALQVNVTGRNGILLQGDGTGDAFLRFDNDGSPLGDHYIFDNSLDNNVLTIESGNDLRLNTNGATERMRIKDNGNVGIGTSNPDYWLHIEGGGDVSDVGGGYMQIGSSAGYNMGLDANEIQARLDSTASILYLQRDGGTLSLAGLGNGEVTVGSVSSTPGTYKLYVQTGILTERVKIATMGSGDWADYVFAEDYDLKSLNEVEQFVQKNKHLPNIPSAQDIEKNGYELQQMDAKLLEKIEELYLHSIKLKKENTHLENKVNQLIKRIEQLENR